ncbi:hypothetical protein P886_3111 [Alteromonadaceae bacterium 2753L.S.0a.02]|nr:hypothetical protein P886_3111 [Alteromonadaceae bacterium 2753L.S.0a.02]
MSTALSKTILFFKNVLVPIIFLLIVVGYIIDDLWTNSGSNQWEAQKTDNSIAIYSLKAPGDPLLKYKVKTRVKASLSNVVAYITNENTAKDIGITDLVRLEEIESEPLFVAYDAYTVALPDPFGKREVVIQLQYSQDPDTKQVEVNVLAAPHKKPRDSDTKRMVYLSNTWLLTPAEDGYVEIEAISEVDFQIPYFVANSVLADVISEQFTIMQNLLKTEKYQRREAAFIHELASI